MNTFKSFALLENRVQVPVLYTENVKEPLSIMECYDEYYNSIMEAEIEFERAYCKGLIAMDEDTTVLNEGIIAGIIEFIQSIITGIIDFFSSLFGGGGSSSSGGSSTSSEVKTTKLYYEKFVKAKDKYVKTIQPNFNIDVTVDGKVLKTSYNTFNPENFINPKQGVAIEFKDETDQLLQFVDKIDAMVYKANLGGTPPVEEIKALEDEVNQASDVYSNYSNNASTRVEYMGSVKLKDYLDTMTEKLSSPEIKTFSEKDPSGDIPDNFKEIIDSLNGLLETCKKSDGRVSAEVTDTVKKALASVSSYTTKLISQYSTVIKERYKWVITELTSYVKAVNSFSTSDTGVVSTNLIEEAAILSLYETNRLIKQTQSLLNEDLTTLYENPFDDLDDFFNESQTMVLNEGIGFGAIKGALGIAVLLCALIIVAIKCIFSGGSSGGGGGSYSGGSSSSPSTPSSTPAASPSTANATPKMDTNGVKKVAAEKSKKAQSTFKREAAKIVPKIKEKFDLKEEKVEKVVEKAEEKVETIVRVFVQFHTRLILCLNYFSDSLGELKNMYNILQSDKEIYNKEIETALYFTIDNFKDLPTSTEVIDRFKIDPQFRSRYESYEKSIESHVNKIVSVIDKTNMDNIDFDKIDEVVKEEKENIENITNDMKSYLDGLEVPELTTYELNKVSITLGKFFSDTIKIFSSDVANSYRDDSEIYANLKQSTDWYNPDEDVIKLYDVTNEFDYKLWRQFSKEDRNIWKKSKNVQQAKMVAKTKEEVNRFNSLHTLIGNIRSTMRDVNDTIYKHCRAPLRQFTHINSCLEYDLATFEQDVLHSLSYDKKNKVLKYNKEGYAKNPKTIRSTDVKTTYPDGTEYTRNTEYETDDYKYDSDFTESVFLDPYHFKSIDVDRIVNEAIGSTEDITDRYYSAQSLDEAKTAILNEGLGALGIKGALGIVVIIAGLMVIAFKSIFGGRSSEGGGRSSAGSSAEANFDRNANGFINKQKKKFGIEGTKAEDIIDGAKDKIKKNVGTFSQQFFGLFLRIDDYRRDIDKVNKISSLVEKSDVKNKLLKINMFFGEDGLTYINKLSDFMRNGITSSSNLVNEVKQINDEIKKVASIINDAYSTAENQRTFYEIGEENLNKLKELDERYKSLLDKLPKLDSEYHTNEEDIKIKLGDYISKSRKVFESEEVKTFPKMIQSFSNSIEMLYIDDGVIESLRELEKWDNEGESVFGKTYSKGKITLNKDWVRRFDSVLAPLILSMKEAVKKYSDYLDKVLKQTSKMTSDLNWDVANFGNCLQNIQYNDKTNQVIYKDIFKGETEYEDDEDESTNESVLLNSSSLHSIKVEQLVAEAVIFSEQITDQERYDKLASLNEAIVRKIQEWWKAGIAKIKALFAKFMEKMNRVTDANYLKKYKDIILKQPFQNRSYKSKDLFGCMNRTLSLQVPYLDYNKHADILKGENPISTFFQRELAPKMQGYAFFKPNNTGAPNTIEQLANYCKDWFMGTQEVEFNGAAVQEHIKDVYDYLMDMKKIKQSIDKSINDIEKSAANVAKIGGTGQAAKQNAEYSATGNAANDAKTTGDNGTGGQNGTPAPAQGGQPQQQAVNASANFDFTNSVYSILYELEVQNPAQQNQQSASGTNANPSASGVRHVEDGTNVDQSAAKDSMLNDVEKVCKNYVDICTTVLKAKLTAIEFTRKELREIVRIHVQDYVGKQDIGKGGEEATNTQQYQNTIANNQV